MRAILLLIGFALMVSYPIGQITLFPLGGFVLIFLAILRMEQVEPAFKKTRYPLYVAFPIAAAVLALEIYATAVGKSTFSGFNAVYTTARILCEIAEGATMFFIYIGMKIIGSNAEVPALEKQSGRNMTVMFVYLVSQIGISLLRLTVPSIFVGFEIVIIYPLALGVLWRAMNIWSAYTLMTKISVSRE